MADHDWHQLQCRVYRYWQARGDKWGYGCNEQEIQTAFPFHGNPSSRSRVPQTDRRSGLRRDDEYHRMTEIHQSVGRLAQFPPDADPRTNRNHCRATGAVIEARRAASVCPSLSFDAVRCPPLTCFADATHASNWL